MLLIGGAEKTRRLIPEQRTFRKLNIEILTRVVSLVGPDFGIEIGRFEIMKHHSFSPLTLVLEKAV